MKKLMSIILAALLVFSLGTAAFAAGGSIALGETKSITLQRDETAAFKFTAEESTLYVAEISSDMGFAMVSVTDEAEDIIDSAWVISFGEKDETDSSFISDEAKIYFCADKGKTFNLEFKENSQFFIEVLEKFDGLAESIVPAKINVTVKKADVRELKLGETYSSSEYREYFLFAPEEDGFYNFRSNSSGNSDPRISITGSDGSYFANDNNGYLADYDFDLTAYFEKGKVYGIEVINTSIEYEKDAEPFTFTVSRGEDIKADYLDIDSRVVFVAVNDTASNFVSCVPSGALEGEYEVTCADETKANAYYDESGLICIEGLSVGKTTVTVTETNSGVSTEFTVIVIPAVVHSIFSVVQNIFWTVVRVISNIIDFITSRIF